MMKRRRRRTRRSCRHRRCCCCRCHPKRSWRSRCCRTMSHLTSRLSHCCCRSRLLPWEQMIERWDALRRQERRVLPLRSHSVLGTLPQMFQFATEKENKTIRPTLFLFTFLKQHWPARFTYFQSEITFCLPSLLQLRKLMANWEQNLHWQPLFSSLGVEIISVVTPKR